MSAKETSFAERAQASAKAKQALLERAKAMSPANDPGYAERQAARIAAAQARDARLAERKAARIAEEKRQAEESAAAEAARIEAARIAEEERVASERAEADRLVALAAEQKAARDARYAARKARSGKKR